MIIVVVIEVASIVFAIVKQDSVLSVLKEIWNGSSIECWKKALKKTFSRKIQNFHWKWLNLNPNLLSTHCTGSKEHIQNVFSCCGFESSQEWLETTNSTISVDSVLPESCGANVNIACKDMLNDWIDNKKVILICIGIGFLTFEFILIGLSIFLIKVINRDHRNIKEMALKKRFGLLDEYGIARPAPGRPSFVPTGSNEGVSRWNFSKVFDFFTWFSEKRSNFVKFFQKFS